MLLVTLLSASLLLPSQAGLRVDASEGLAPASAARGLSAVTLAQAAPVQTETKKSPPLKSSPQKPSPPQPKEPKAAAGSSMAPEVKALVDRMQAFYEGTQDFTADFEQRYAYAASRRKQSSSGKVTFKKPALMRWEYGGDSARTFVLAGEKVYMHDPAAMLLTKGNVATSQLSASVTFLWGQGKLADEFAIEKKQCASCKGVQLQLTPLQPDPRFKRILLEVDPATAVVIKSTVIDPDGSTNEITFKNLRTNVGVNESAFKLNPPEGTQVQDFTQAGR